MRPTVWWHLKVAATVALILWTLARLLVWNAMVAGSAPVILAGQLLAVAGGTVNAWGYLALRRAQRREGAARLVTAAGPYRFVRHPMYFGDILWTAGMALLAGATISAVMWACAVVAVVQCCRNEDCDLAHRHPVEHAEWRGRTATLIPFLW